MLILDFGIEPYCSKWYEHLLDIQVVHPLYLQACIQSLPNGRWNLHMYIYTQALLVNASLFRSHNKSIL